jgi:hypothetical protein
MMPQRILALLVLLLLPPATLLGQQQTKALTNQDVVSMVAGGLDEGLVIGAIEANTDNFDVSANALLDLKKSGVGDKIIQAMLAAEAKKHSPPSAAAAASALESSPQTATTATGLAMNPSAINPMLGQAAAAQAMAMQMMAAGGMSPQMMAQIAAAQRGRVRGGMAMNPRAAMVAGNIDSSQLPRVALITGEKKEPLNPSITQIAKSEIKGGRSRGGMGSMSPMAALGMRGGVGGMGGLSSLSLMGGLGSTALSFAPLAAGPGIMFAGPAMHLATGLLGGGLTHHSSAPKATYVWALPGAHSAYVMPATTPKFEIEFGDIVGLDPDVYEPALVKLTQTKDNWRLVGATKDSIDKRGNEKQSAITEDRTEIKTTAIGRGHVIVETAAPLAPGEYGVVLHPTKAQKTSTSTGAGPTAEQTLFYSVWDFSVPAEASSAAARH